MSKTKINFINKAILTNKFKQLQYMVSKNSIKTDARTLLYKNFLTNLNLKKSSVKNLFNYNELKFKLLSNKLNFKELSINKDTTEFNFIKLNKHLSSCKLNKDNLFLILNKNNSCVWVLKFSAYIFLKLYVKYTPDPHNLEQSSQLVVNKPGKWLRSTAELHTFLTESLTALFENYLYITDFSLEVYWLPHKHKQN